MMLMNRYWLTGRSNALVQLYCMLIIATNQAIICLANLTHSHWLTGKP
ncbi:hypothetical protein MICCA_1340007 [Microcystis aeruginosa PCC 9432]|uniref:Uncharacterized protein n=2 Tax=Microcystis aeruginosa TaxID=1126 RepID=A0A822L8G2_MICAE|nr:hypothetical protein MICCA_1340007 [Microcystis aeruginosa PCC 9432]CCI28395.1 hypothetical protein MICAG_4620002 [Microcystis aeruginosa PCC 9808]